MGDDRRMATKVRRRRGASRRRVDCMGMASESGDTCAVGSTQGRRGLLRAPVWPGEWRHVSSGRPMYMAPRVAVTAQLAAPPPRRRGTRHSGRREAGTSKTGGGGREAGGAGAGAVSAMLTASARHRRAENIKGRRRQRTRTREDGGRINGRRRRTTGDRRGRRRRRRRQTTTTDDDDGIDDDGRKPSGRRCLVRGPARLGLPPCHGLRDRDRLDPPQPLWRATRVGRPGGAVGLL